MKLKDCVNLTKNKRTKQMSFNVKKRKIKEMDVSVRDLMNLDIPISKKLRKFEEL